MIDKPLWMIASALFFGIAMYMHIKINPETWLGLINYFMYFCGLQVFGWIAFWRAM